MKRQLKRLFNWCPQPQAPNYRVLKQYSKPILSLVMVGIIAISIFAAATIALNHAPTPPPITLPTATPTLTAAPTMQPTAIPKPSASQTPMPTSFTSPTLIPTSTPIAAPWTTEFPTGTQIFSIVKTGDNLAVIFNDGNITEIGSDGKMIWSKTYKEISKIAVFDGIQTSEGGFALAGSIGSIVGLVKTDAAGNLKWNQTYSLAGYASSIIQTDDGGYMLSGTSGYLDRYSDHRFSTIFKVDSSGVIEWSKNISQNYYLYSMAKTLDGAAVLTGYNTTEQTSTLLVKMNSSGNILWNQTYQIGLPTKVFQCSDGGFAIIGSDVIMKTDSNGTKLWDVPLVSASFFTSLVETNDSYIVAGSIRNGQYNFDGLLEEINFNGTQIRNQTFPEFYQFTNILRTNDGGFIIGDHEDPANTLPITNYYSLITKLMPPLFK
jgi:hypothetical protein